MCVGHRILKWTPMLLFLAGVLCDVWEVKYHQQLVCAVKGSSVVLLCTFSHPDDQTVERVIWVHRGKVLRKLDRRFTNTGDKHHICSLKIHQVDFNHAGTYSVRFVNHKNGLVRPPNLEIRLKVVDLNISGIKPNTQPTKEGDSVELTCSNSCDGGNVSSELIWFKNGESIHEGPVLYLRNMSSTNSGNYTCSLKQHAATTSGVIRVDVEYGPKNTSVFVSPSVEVNAGTNLTLTCSSDANPPVETYTWFKLVDDRIMSVGHQPVFWPGDGGQYLCSASNKHGSQNSSAVTVTIKQNGAKSLRDTLIIIITAAAAVLLIVITVITVNRLNKKRMWAAKADCEQDTEQNTDYVNWLICDDNPLQDRDEGERPETTVVYATVYFHNKRNTEHPKDSSNEDVIYSTLCRELNASQDFCILVKNCLFKIHQEEHNDTGSYN